MQGADRERELALVCKCLDALDRFLEPASRRVDLMWIVVPFIFPA